MDSCVCEGVVPGGGLYRVCCPLGSAPPCSFCFGTPEATRIILATGQFARVHAPVSRCALAYVRVQVHVHVQCAGAVYKCVAIHVLMRASIETLYSHFECPP